MSESKQKRVLVAGGAGFIGSSFVELLVKRGYQVIILDALTYAGHRENLDSIQGAGSFELIHGNICDTERVEALLSSQAFDWILNFAAESHVDRSISGPDAFMETNIQGTYRLLNASLDHWKRLPAERKEGFRYLQISTDEVYGSLGASGKFSEKSSFAPNSPYSSSKAAGDLLVRAWYHTYGLPTLTTNCSNNYGPRQFPEKLIPHMITCALEGKPLPVYGDGGNVRDWIHVEDHCAGVLLALENGRPGATYCLGGNAEQNNLDLVKMICATLDVLQPRTDRQPYCQQISFVTDRPGHDRRYAIDDSLAQKELGFRRRYDFSDGLRNTIQWYLENREWCQKVRQKNAIRGDQQ